jgi:transcriptional regulator with XRE-family HTH domain
MTINDLAQRIGVSRPTIWSWEHNRSIPRRAHRQALADTFDLALEQLTAGRQDPTMRSAKPTLKEAVAESRRAIAEAAGAAVSVVEITIKL